MAFPSSYTDIMATTIEQRSGDIADNVTKNNGLLAYLNERGRVKPFSGGWQLIEELSFAANGNASFYSGYDTLPVAAQDVISAAYYGIKQVACPVVLSGLEMLQNSGKEAIIDLMEGRLNVAIASVKNLMAQGLYSDGTGYGGKQITGLLTAVSTTPTTGVYGGIDRSTTLGAFWQNQVVTTTATQSNIQSLMNQLWVKQVRGSDRPNLIIADNNLWTLYIQSLQSLQRFTSSSDKANLGFGAVKFMDCDVILDGGIGGFAPASRMYFLNLDYLQWRPHSQRNMKPLSPNRRVAVNQDAEVEILAWAGNLTCSGAQFQGVLNGS